MLVYWGANGGAVIVDYGIWTLLPIVVVVAVALKSRRALEPLILGTLLTYIIVDGLSFPIGWMDAFFRVATDQSHQWVFMVCGLFGALIALLGASHGTLGFSRLLGRLCRGPRTTLIVTWVMGILIFVDDYLNIMTLSTCMRKLTDRGATVVVIEHDMEVLLHADYILELGPGAGKEGGNIIFEGHLRDFLNEDTKTSYYLKKALNAKKDG